MNNAALKFTYTRKVAWWRVVKDYEEGQPVNPEHSIELQNATETMVNRTNCASPPHEWPVTFQVSDGTVYKGLISNEPTIEYLHD